MYTAFGSHTCSEVVVEQRCPVGYGGASWARTLFLEQRENARVVGVEEKCVLPHDVSHSSLVVNVTA